MDKRLKEIEVLEISTPTLKHIYGDFYIDPDQADRPDAAIVLESNGDIIGIEITSVDRGDVQQYFNDEKIERDLEVNQTHELISTGRYSNRPNKKYIILFPHDFIFNGALKKSKKYRDYFKPGRYKEVVLIVFSEYLEVSGENFETYYKPWTWHLLNEASFPFDKVIFACTQCRDSIIIFDKSLPPPQPPEINYRKEQCTTRVDGPILPVNKEIDFFEITCEEPNISQDKKENKKAKASKNRGK